MTIDLSPALEAKLASLASDLHRPTAEVAQEALADYVRHVESLAAEVREAEVRAEREGWMTTDEVFARILANRKTA